MNYILLLLFVLLVAVVVMGIYIMRKKFDCDMKEINVLAKNASPENNDIQFDTNTLTLNKIKKAEETISAMQERISTHKSKMNNYVKLMDERITKLSDEAELLNMSEDKNLKSAKLNEMQNLTSLKYSIDVDINNFN